MEVEGGFSPRKSKYLYYSKTNDYCFDLYEEKVFHFLIESKILERFCAMQLPRHIAMSSSSAKFRRVREQFKAITIGVSFGVAAESSANRKDRLRQISPERLPVIVTRMSFSTFRNKESSHENTLSQ